MWNQRRTILDYIPMFVAIFVVFFTFVQCQNQRVASANPPKVTSQEGERVDILCTFGIKVDKCTFVLPDGRNIKLNKKWDKNHDNYKYFGSDLNEGQCGMTILRLEREHEGNITCRLDLGDGGDDAIAVIPVEIARPPQNPVLLVRNDKRLEAGQEMEAECEYADGNPPADVSWFLGGELIIPTKNPEHYGIDQKNTVVSVILHRLSADDNLKSLVCRLNHPAFPNGYTNTSYQLNVNYRPMTLNREELHITGLEIGRTVDIVLRIRANPRPRLQWTVDGSTLNEGTQNDKFIVNQAEQDEEGRWIAKLTVINLSLQDTLKSYMLRASNDFGINDYTVRIGGSQELDDSGLGIVPIIAITIISIFVLIVVALLVVARITKRWCFAGASMHPNSPDSEAHIAHQDEEKNHEHYEQPEKITDDETGDVDHKTNGKSNGNTSV